MTNNEIVKEAIKKKGCTIKTLSIETGISQAWLYHITGSKEIGLGEEVCKKLNKALDINLTYKDKLENKNPLARKVYMLRKEKNLTIEQLSTLSNVAIDSLYGLENGKYKNTYKETLEKIAKVLDVNANELKMLQTTYSE